MPLLTARGAGIVAAAAAAAEEWTLVGQTSHTQLASSGANAIPLPAGLIQGDIIIVVFGCDTAAAEGLTTAGYTSLYNTTTGIPEAQVAYKVMGATPDTTVTITNTSTFKSVAAVQAWRGMHQLSPIDASLVVAEGASGLPNPPSCVTVTDGALVLAIAILDDIDIAPDIIAPSGYGNLLAADCDVNLASGGATVMMASKTKSAAGAEDPPAFGGTGSGVWDAVTFALRSASASVPAGVLPTWAITGISITSSTGRFRSMDGSDNANRTTLGPNAAHYGIWGDGGGFGASGTGIIDAGLPNAGANVRAAMGLARWHGHLDRTTIAGWKNAANGTTPPGNNVSSSFIGATRNTESTSVMTHGKSWAPFYIGDVLYELQSEQPTYLTTALPQEEWNNLSLFKSTDHGRSWTKVFAWADLTIASIQYALPCSSVATAGQCHRARPDDYVYFIARNTPSTVAYGFYASNSQILFRAPIGSIETQGTWEWLVSVDGSNNPTWSTNIANRGAVPGLSGTNLAHWNQGFDYIPCIDRYLFTRNENGISQQGPLASTSTTTLGVWEAPKPWGPWTRVVTPAIANFDPDANSGTHNYLFSFGLPQGEILQPTWDGSAWKLPVIFAYTGTGANPGYDALGATTAELTLSLTDGSSALLVDGYQRYITEPASLTNNFTLRIGTGVGNNRMLVVMFTMGNQTPTSVVVDPDGGAPKTMTLIANRGSTNANLDATGGNTRVCAFGLLDAGMPSAAGTYTVRVTNTTAGNEQAPLIEAWSLRGAAQDLSAVQASVQVAGNASASSSITVPNVTAAQKGAMLFSCVASAEGLGINLLKDGWLLTFAHNIAQFSGEAGGFGVYREKADAPVAQSVVWQTRSLTLGSLQTAVRLAAMTFAVRPASSP